MVELGKLAYKLVSTSYLIIIFFLILSNIILRYSTLLYSSLRYSTIILFSNQLRPIKVNFSILVLSIRIQLPYSTLLYSTLNCEFLSECKFTTACPT